MDNFKGQTTKAVLDLLESDKVLVPLLPPNTTYALQPMDLSRNKAVKHHLQDSFENWYAQEIIKQLQEDEESGNELCEYSLL